MTSAQDPVEAVREAFARARERQRKVLERDGSAPASLVEFFSDADHRRVHLLARAIRDADPDTFALYAGEMSVMGAVLDQLEDAPETPTLTDVAAALATRANESGPWLVATPIANLVPASSYHQLSKDLAVVATDPDPKWADDLWDNPLWERDAMIRREFGNRVTVQPRWLDARYHVGPLDTRVGAYLVSREDGHREVALATARSRVHYLVAVWTTLQPPTPRAISPSLGVWVPQPHVDIGQNIESLGDRAYRPSRTVTHSDYDLPTDNEVLLPAVSALANVSESRFAQGFLSACWAVHQAVRQQFNVQLTDRLSLVYTAVASLCEEPGRHDDDAVGKRWGNLCARLETSRWLKEGRYTNQDAVLAQQLVLDARHISTHGADAALINLGYPASAVRTLRGPRERRGSELARSAVLADLRLTLTLLHRVLQDLASLGHESAWSDDRLDDLLAASR